MTGTGTQADPYIVDNWPDFITAVGTSGAYVEFPKDLVKTKDSEIVEGKLYVDGSGEAIKNPVPANLENYYENTFVLDQNDYAEEGISTILEINCTSFNGYGGKITNIHFVVGGYLRVKKVSSVKNVNFDNWLIDSINSYQIYGGNFYKCIFSAQFFVSNTFIYGHDDVYGRPLVKQCSFYMTSRTNITFNVNETYFNEESLYNRFYLDSTVGGTINLYKINFSLIQGTVQGTVCIYERSKYSVVDCVAGAIAGGSYLDHVLANTDKCTNIETYYIRLTTEEMTNPEELERVGFMVQT